MSSENWRLQVERSPRSVVVTLRNYTAFPLSRSHYTLDAGKFLLFPQETIPPYSEVEFAAFCKGLLSGVEGSVTYKLFAQGSEVFVRFEWKNPVIENRSAQYRVGPDSFRKHFDVVFEERNDAQYRLTWNLNTNLKPDPIPPPDAPTRLISSSKLTAGGNPLSALATEADNAKLVPDQDMSWVKDQTKSGRSVTVIVQNHTAVPFYRKKYHVFHGIWSCFPADVILPGQASAFGSRGTTYLSGTKAQVTYAPEDSDDAIDLTFDNPFLGELQVKSSQPTRYKIDQAFKKQEHVRWTLKITPAQVSDEIGRSPTLINLATSKTSMTKVNPWKGSADEGLDRSDSSAALRLDLVHNAAKTRIFGVPLQVITDKERRSVPFIVTAIKKHILSEGIQTSGLFINPGSYHQVKRLRDEFNRCVEVDLGKYALHSIGTAFKMFLRELPEPLIPLKAANYYFSFVNVTTESLETTQDFYLRFIQGLPTPNQHTLRCLLDLFETLVSSEMSDLGYEEIGIVFPEATGEKKTNPAAAKALSILVWIFPQVDPSKSPPASAAAPTTLASASPLKPIPSGTSTSIPKGAPAKIATPAPSTAPNR